MFHVSFSVVIPEGFVGGMNWGVNLDTSGVYAIVPFPSV